jgi:antitoxin ParD1/3/4
MSSIDKISISITAQQHELVKAAIERGDYASTSEVIREALRDWELKQRLRATQVEEIRRLWDEGIASGPSVDGPTAMAALSEKLDIKAIIAEARTRVENSQKTE